MSDAAMTADLRGARAAGASGLSESERSLLEVFAAAQDAVLAYQARVALEGHLPTATDRALRERIRDAPSARALLRVTDQDPKTRRQAYRKYQGVHWTLVCLALIAARILRTGSLGHVFLVWNLALAWIPLVYAFIAYRLYRSRFHNFILIALCAGIWLLFLPNAPYILTDLIHFRVENNPIFWYDLLMLLWFSWTGFLLGFASLYLMQQIVADAFGRFAGWLFVFIGAVPRTDWLGELFVRDARGFVLTGLELLAGDGAPPPQWPLERDPYVLESSVPGVFVAGDHRDTPSTQGALVSGRRAAEAVAAALGGPERTVPAGSTGSPGSTSRA